MDIYMREQELVQLLKSIEFLESQIEDIIVSYYMPFPVKVNGITIQTSIFDIIQSIKSTYTNVILKEFYNEISKIKDEENI